MRKKEANDHSHDDDHGAKEGKDRAGQDQRDPRDDAGHMPRHWQAPGTRGETAGQPPPGPDRREVARGNQYGRAGQVASEQLRESTTEHGQTPPPQRRDNEQLPKRPGERPSDDLPTPRESEGRE